MIVKFRLKPGNKYTTQRGKRQRVGIGNMELGIGSYDRALSEFAALYVGNYANP